MSFIVSFIVDEVIGLELNRKFQERGSGGKVCSIRKLSITVKGSGFVEKSGVFLTAKRHFESTSIATPHIGFGIGWQKDYWKIQNTAATIIVDDSDSAFNYGFLVGATFDLSQSLQLNLDYRYRFMGELTGVSTQCGTTTCSDFSGTTEKYRFSTIAVSISKSF